MTPLNYLTCNKQVVTTWSPSGNHFLHPLHCFLWPLDALAVNRFMGSKTRDLQKDHTNKGLPAYNGKDKALAVFSNPYFYNDLIFNHTSDQRQQVLQDFTVMEIYEMFALRCDDGLKSGLISFANAIKSDMHPIIEYFSQAPLIIENNLATKGIIDLSGGSLECDIFNKRLVHELPTMHRIWHTSAPLASSNYDTSEKSPVGIVVGPSGSGKTFFALQQLATKFFKDDGELGITIYLHPDKTNIDFAGDFHPVAAPALIDWIQNELSRVTGYRVKDPLNMHVCLICDDTNFWFRKDYRLLGLSGEAKRLSKRASIVVAGTAHDIVYPFKNSFEFRMQPWQVDDISALVKREMFTESWMMTEDGSTDATTMINTLANTIFAHPKLHALATNGCTAYFLVQAIAQRNLQYSPSRSTAWKVKLDEWAPEIVDQVIATTLSPMHLVVCLCHSEGVWRPASFVPWIKSKKGMLGCHD